MKKRKKKDHTESMGRATQWTNSLIKKYDRNRFKLIN